MVAAAKSAVTTPEIYSTFTKRSKLKSKDMNQETQEPKRVRAVQLGQMLKMEFAPDIQLLGQLIFAKTIGMIAGPRGGGKSLLSMLMSYAVAGGKELAPWGNGSGMPVAYFDGEMRAISFQSRLRLLHARNEAPGSMRNVQKNLHIISRDFAKDVIGYIDQVEGQRRIDALIPDEVKLIVIDNLSAWTSGGREDGGSWATIKAWLIEKRLQGKSVLLVHHTGKNGKQRGSSAHEDLLDYSILLSPTANNGDEQDTRFTVEHTKLRDHLPHLKQRYEFAIYTKDEKLYFDVAPAGMRFSEHAQEMLDMHTINIPMSEIAEKFRVNKSTVSRTIQRLKAIATSAEAPAAVA